MGNHIDFDWDPAKAAFNVQKHRISFDDAITVFDDPHHYIVDVTKPGYGEARFIAIGALIDGRMAAVVYTDRQRRRIISARKVRKNEQREYDIRQASP
jgi:uncharacterized DUF497 family protein